MIKNFINKSIKSARRKKLSLLFLFALILVGGCSNEKLDLNKITNSVPAAGGKLSDTVYIKLNPDWTGFNKPEDIIIGREPFIYVADTYNDQIVMLNLAGQVLGKCPVKHPVALAQDYQLNLIVCAQFDTLVNGITESVSAVYKIDLVPVGHNITLAPITRILPTKDDFRFLFEVKRREYTGVCAFFDNSFYVSRKGPKNDSPIDPDNSILVFHKKVLLNGSKTDTLIGRVPLLTPEGTGILSANKISSLTSFDKRNVDFIMTMVGNNSFKTQWLQYVETADFSGYVNKLSPSNAAMMQVNRFGSPEDVAIDGSGNIFIADAQKDSVFKFSVYGEELQSFGGPTVFKSPHAVAIFDKTLYVADTENNRILRFILSTEIN
ncbi:MAG: hypothetical protein NTX22_00340 [Ignavibacteriales bacterium]|nr:hypothetical protein [Ignavibacteriales bacterium]